MALTAAALLPEADLGMFSVFVRTEPHKKGPPHCRIMSLFADD